jgi:hypothetical protein
VLRDDVALGLEGLVRGVSPALAALALVLLAPLARCAGVAVAAHVAGEQELELEAEHAPLLLVLLAGWGPDADAY